ncbi:hypothetical protein ACTXT7_013896 [Hymenolepis weldensis]
MYPMPPYWEPFGDRKHFLWKACSTAAACEAERKLAGYECMREWYMDWRCVECCQGELCNYYATRINLQSDSKVSTAVFDNGSGTIKAGFAGDAPKNSKRFHVNYP